MSALLRRATIDDIPALVHHRQEMFTEMAIEGDYDAMRPAFADWLTEMIPAEIYLAWVIEVDGSIVAGAGLILHRRAPAPQGIETQSGYVYNVYVEPSDRMQGHARRIMEAIHEHCRAHGVRLVALHASKFGRHLYESMGYQPSNEMRLDLRQQNEQE